MAKTKIYQNPWFWIILVLIIGALWILFAFDIINLFQQTGLEPTHTFSGSGIGGGGRI